MNRVMITYLGVANYVDPIKINRVILTVDMDKFNKYIS